MAITYNKPFVRGLESIIDKKRIVDGKFLFTTDTSRLFIDYGSSRLEISDVIKTYSEGEILAIIAPLPKLYISSDTHKIFMYASDGWVCLNNNDDVSNAEHADTADKADVAEKAIKDDNGNKIVDFYSPIESPVFKGVPKAPKPSGDSDNEQIATTSFVQEALVKGFEGITHINTLVVDTLPSSAIKNTIYFVKNKDDNTVYDMHILSDSTLKYIGSTKISLDGYYNNYDITGTGNAITEVSTEGNIIHFKKNETFLTEHPSIEHEKSETEETAHAGQVINIIDELELDDNAHVVRYRVNSLTLPLTASTATYAHSAKDAERTAYAIESGYAELAGGIKDDSDFDFGELLPEPEPPAFVPIVNRTTHWNPYTEIIEYRYDWFDEFGIYHVSELYPTFEFIKGTGWDVEPTVITVNRIKEYDPEDPELVTRIYYEWINEDGEIETSNTVPAFPFVRGTGWEDAPEFIPVVDRESIPSEFGLIEYKYIWNDENENYHESMSYPDFEFMKGTGWEDEPIPPEPFFIPVVNRIKEYIEETEKTVIRYEWLNSLDELITQDTVPSFEFTKGTGWEDAPSYFPVVNKVIRYQTSIPGIISIEYEWLNEDGDIETSVDYPEFEFVKGYWNDDQFFPHVDRSVTPATEEDPAIYEYSWTDENLEEHRMNTCPSMIFYRGEGWEDAPEYFPIVSRRVDAENIPTYEWEDQDGEIVTSTDYPNFEFVKGYWQEDIDLNYIPIVDRYVTTSEDGEPIYSYEWFDALSVYHESTEYPDFEFTQGVGWDEDIEHETLAYNIEDDSIEEPEVSQNEASEEEIEDTPVEESENDDESVIEEEESVLTPEIDPVEDISEEEIDELLEMSTLDSPLTGEEIDNFIKTVVLDQPEENSAEIEEEQSEEVAEESVSYDDIEPDEEESSEEVVNEGELI